MASPYLLFLKEFANNFHTTGAVAPSSKGLARRMVAALAPGSHHVVELGPGTGVFTAELLRAGVKPDHLIAVEFNQKFFEVLKSKFPKVHLVHGDAGALPQHIAQKGLSKVHRIISGLPFRSLPQEVGDLVAKAIGDVLAPGGIYVQFTYALKPPLSETQASKAGLTGKRVAFAPANLPPAFVWRYVKAL